MSDGRLSYQFSSDGYIRRSVYAYHPASSYVETYVGRAVPTGQYRIDRPSGPLTSLYDKGGRLDIANYCTVSLF
ncbi:hypothetical protein ACN79_09710 [Escherichia coli]|nr:hypothetical protein ACN79_09710 [Escherichia coli]